MKKKIFVQNVVKNYSEMGGVKHATFAGGVAVIYKWIGKDYIYLVRNVLEI